MCSSDLLPHFSHSVPVVVQAKGLYGLGNHVQDCLPIGLTVSKMLVASLSKDIVLGGEYPFHWYGVFLVEDDDGGIKMVFTPFLRVRKQQGEKLYLADHFNKNKPLDYGFKTRELEGLNFIVLTNKLGFSNIGRVERIVGNGSDWLETKEVISDLDEGAFMMLAPNSRAYHYIGCVLNDDASNIVNFTKFRGEYHSLGYTFINTKEMDRPTMVSFDGRIPPTAMKAHLRIKVLSKRGAPRQSSFGGRLLSENVHTVFETIVPISDSDYVQSHSNVGSVIPKYPHFVGLQKIAPYTAEMKIQVMGYEE